MDKRRDILDELQKISNLVAGLPAAVPYELPAGYFDQLSTQVLDRVLGNEAETNAGQWLPAGGELPFSVPEGYFDHFATGLMQRIKAMEEGAPKEETQALSPLLGSMDKKLPFSLPEDYFVELPDEVITGIQAIDFVNQELEIMPQAMQTAGKSNVYQVPEGYFNSLAPAVLHRIKTRQPANIVRVNFGRRLMRYAAAALLAGAIATGAQFIFRNAPAAASGADALNMKKLSSNEMLSYLENNPVAFSETTMTSDDIREEDIKQLLADVPENELQQYVNQYAISKNTVIN